MGSDFRREAGKNAPERRLFPARFALAGISFVNVCVLKVTLFFLDGISFANDCVLKVPFAAAKFSFEKKSIATPWSALATSFSSLCEAGATFVGIARFFWFVEISGRCPFTFVRLPSVCPPDPTAVSIFIWVLIRLNSAAAVFLFPCKCTGICFLTWRRTRLFGLLP